MSVKVSARISENQNALLKKTAELLGTKDRSDALRFCLNFVAINLSREILNGEAEEIEKTLHAALKKLRETRKRTQSELKVSDISS